VNWFDRQRNEDCAFKVANDGLLRCLPLHADNAPTSYSDPMCTTPVMYFLPARCSAPPPYSVVPYSGNGCRGTYQVYQAQPQPISPTPANYYSKTVTGSCVQRAIGAAELFALSSVEPSAFVAGEIVRTSATGRL